jgi:hypothetical protein
LVTPYVDIATTEENVWFRTFAYNCEGGDLHWHMDKKDRLVSVVHNSAGWLFQNENALPCVMEEGATFIIKKMEYHRLIKGKPSTGSPNDGTLILKIIEPAN